MELKKHVIFGLEELSRSAGRVGVPCDRTSFGTCNGAPIKFDYFITFQWFINFQNPGHILQRFFMQIRVYLNDRNFTIYNFPVVAIKSQW